MLYFVIFAYISTFLVLDLTKFLRFNKIALVVLYLFLILFIGARYEIGGDWNYYLYEMFYKDARADLGYEILSLIGKNISAQYGIIFVNLCCAFLFLSCFFFIVTRFRYPFAGLLVAFPYSITIVAMGYTRQSVAIGFGLVAMYFMARNHNFKSMIFILIGGLFHKSIAILLIFLPLLYLRQVDIKKVYMGIVFFIVLVLICFKFDIFAGYISKIKFLYLSDIHYSKGGFIRIAIHIIPLILYIFMRKDIKNRNNINYILFDELSILIVVAMFLSIFLSTLVDRLGLYFIFFDIVIFSIFLERLEIKLKFTLVFLIIIENFLIFYVWYNYSFYAIHYWQPYKNFFLEVL
ncbi:EpsG family protein [Campylobacter concisus]|uniref:EpsG family protein n=1 Tax=Campylobacter concisus TaxID=199 RepID=UPI003D1F9437